MNKPSIAFIVILCIFGIAFISLLVHEGVHVIQSESPESICYDMQQNSLMHIEVNLSDYNSSEEFKGFVSYTEKWGRIGALLSVVLISIGIGMVFMCYGRF